MKNRNRISLIVICLLLLCIIFAISNIYSKKNTYKVWVKEYLGNRYLENMTVKNIYFNEMGYCAVVATDVLPDLDFKVMAKYTDRYLERVLEYIAEQEIEKLLNYCKCTASMFSMESIENPYPELYELYKQLKRPPTWNDVPQYVRLNELFIRINGELSMNDANKIMQNLQECNFTSHNVDIIGTNKSYSFAYDEQMHEYNYRE